MNQMSCCLGSNNQDELFCFLCYSMLYLFYSKPELTFSEINQYLCPFIHLYGVVLRSLRGFLDFRISGYNIEISNKVPKITQSWLSFATTKNNFFPSPQNKKMIRLCTRMVLLRQHLWIPFYINSSCTHRVLPSVSWDIYFNQIFKQDSSSSPTTKLLPSPRSLHLT